MRSLVRIKRYTDDLDSAASIIIAMALLIEARDGNTEGHCHRMANYATALGRALDLSEDDLQALHRGGFLHDIGMLAIPDCAAAEDRAARPRRVRADEVAHDGRGLALRQPALARFGAADHPAPPRALRRFRLSRRPGRRRHSARRADHGPRRRLRRGDDAAPVSGPAHGARKPSTSCAARSPAAGAAPISSTLSRRSSRAAGSRRSRGDLSETSRKPSALAIPGLAAYDGSRTTILEAA